MAPLAQAWLLLVGSTLLGGRVIQAHVLLARSSAHHPQVLGHMVISKQPLLSDLCVFTRLREVPCGLAGGPGRGAQGNVDAAGRLGVTGVAPLGSSPQSRFRNEGIQLESLHNCHVRATNGWGGSEEDGFSAQ